MTRNIKIRFWVDALLARAHAAGASGYIVHKGDEDAGSIIIKVTGFRQIPRILIQSRNMEGDLIFVDISPTIIKGENEYHIAEKHTDEYIEKRIKQDRDVWIVEIDDKELRHFLTETVE